jgi:tetratricopeptide (TPR) repeat protein
MKRLFVLFTVLIGLMQPGKACLNIFAADSSGHEHILEHEFFYDVPAFKAKETRAYLEKYAKKLQSGTATYKDISDYASFLLVAGKVTEGLDIFRMLIQKYPDMYEINANIGVAYELNGEVDSALYYVRRSLEINPRAHYDSEWIHVNILEHKKSRVGFAGLITEKKILVRLDSLDKRIDGRSPQINCQNECIFKSALHQLQERIPFTHAPDPVMAQMLIELGDAYMNFSVFRSWFLYRMAVYFNPAAESFLKDRIERARLASERNKSRFREKRMTSDVPLFSEKKITQYIEKLAARPRLLLTELRVFDRQQIAEQINRL